MNRGTPFDFLEECRLVLLAGRRYYVRKPTVATVLTLVGLFGDELASFARKFKDQPEALGSDPAVSIARALVALGRHRIARILATCVDLAGAEPADVEEIIAADATGDTARVLAGAACRLCDAGRIAEHLGLDRVPAGEPPAESASGPTTPLPMTADLVELWKLTGTAPGDLLSWPYEAYLTASETVAWLALPPEQRPGKWVDPTQLTGMGLAYSGPPAETEGV